MAYQLDRMKRGMLICEELKSIIIKMDSLMRFQNRLAFFHLDRSSEQSLNFPKSYFYLISSFSTIINFKQEIKF